MLLKTIIFLGRALRMIPKSSADRLSLKSLGQELQQQGYEYQLSSFSLGTAELHQDLVVFTKTRTFIFWVETYATFGSVTEISNAIKEIEDHYISPLGVLICEFAMFDSVQKFAESTGVWVNQGVEGIRERIEQYEPTEVISD